MPLVDIQVIEGVFTKEDKERMIKDVTNAMVAIEGEAMRGVTWVRVQDVPSGQWGMAGRPMETEDGMALKAIA